MNTIDSSPEDGHDHGVRQAAVHHWANLPGRNGAHQQQTHDAIKLDRADPPDKVGAERFRKRGRHRVHQ
jgi:hypothetical protein